MGAVPSGRSVSERPPRSVKVNISLLTMSLPSPTPRTNRSVVSKLGVSMRWNPNRPATTLAAASNAPQYGWSAGRRSCVPRGRWAMGAMASKLSEWFERFGRRRLARHLRLGGRGVAANHPVAARPLGDVERLVGGLHQGLAAFAVPRKDGDSQTQRKIGDRFAVEQHGLAGHGSPDPFGDRDRRPAVRAPQN